MTTTTTILLTVPPLAQMSHAWHETGLFMGMHWGWWTFWVLTLLVLGWGFWRLRDDRAGTHREEQRREDAEEELRRRFAQGEMEEDEYARKMEVLRETRGPVG